MTFPRYPKYKDSGVEWLGEVPEHWSVKRLRFVAKMNPPKSEVSALPPETMVSFLPMEAIGDDGSLVLEAERPLQEVLTGYTYFRDGDVTIAKITPCYENGKGAVMDGLRNGVGFGTTELIVVRPEQRETVAEFLHYMFVSQPFRQKGESHMYGAGGQKRVPDAFVEDFAAAIPSLLEQRQVVDFLDRETARIDALIAEQRRLMELLKEKRQAVISHAVTKGLNPDVPMKDSGIEWLGEVPAHWEITPVKHLAKMASGGTPSKERLDWWHGDVPWASSKDMKCEELSDTQDHLTTTALEEGAATLAPVGSVFIVVRGMILSHTFPVVVSLTPMAFNQDLKALTAIPRMRQDYLAWLLRGTAKQTLARVDEAAHGTTVLRMDAWGLMPLPVPPLDEQEAIVRFLRVQLASLDSLSLDVEHAIDLLLERRTALISAAVTGQIDVRQVGGDMAA